MSTKHTPRPFTYGYTGSIGYCIYGGGQHIATSHLYKKDGGEDNARLFAAAPDLLEALQEARAGLAWYQEMCPQFTDGSDDEAMARIDSAIARATGEAA